MKKEMRSEKSSFQQRFAEYEDELKWLYMELYSGRDEDYQNYVKMLREYCTERSPELKAWDRSKQEDPDWYKRNDLLGTMMYTENFGKTLKGVESRLDYLQECGINFLHLMPLLESPEGKSDGGYSVSDFRKVQPQLGTMEDLSELTHACHKRNIQVCLDFVMNHTSDEHEWAKQAKAGDPYAQGRYFFFDNWDIPNQFEQTVPQVFPQTAPGNFSWCDEAHKVVMTTFHPYQWDLNFRNPSVMHDMTANLLNLCNHGIDIIRLDAVPYIWKELGTSCRNLLRVHTLVRILRMVLDIVCPGTLLLGEIVMKPNEVAPYFGTPEKPECHMVYNAPIMATTWHTVATRDVRLLKHQIGQTLVLPHDFVFLNYLRCHDDIGWGLDYDFLAQFGTTEAAHKHFLNDYLQGHWEGSDARGELYNDDPRLQDARLCGTTASLCGIEAAEYEQNDWKLERAETLDIMLHAFLLTQSGIPMLYSGDEIGQRNDYSYHEDPLKWDDSRYLHRGKFPWEQAAMRDDETTRPGRIFQAIKRMEKIRRSHVCFENNADVWIMEPYNDHILALGRYYKGEKLVALFNFNVYDETAWVNESEEYVDLITGEHCHAQGVPVPARRFRWLLTDFGTNSDQQEKKKDGPKIVFLDIDGTLTKSGENTPPKSALQAIRKAQENGHYVFLCTGRNLAMAEPLLKYGFDGIIASAGALVIAGGEVLHDEPMEPEDFRKAMDALQSNHVYCTIESKEGSYCDPDIGKLLKGQPRGNSELERWRKQINESLGIKPMKEYKGEPVYKIVIMFNDRRQLKEAEELLPQYDFVLQDEVFGVQNGELIRKTCNKGTGVKCVSEKLNIPLEDTIGFGDSMNDYAMMKTTGISVCMGNGSETLKKHSDIIADPVDEDGLAGAFERLHLI